MSLASRRCLLTCRGAVQGVGFRPFVYRLATSLGLAGSVRNTPAGVVIELEGPPRRVGEFLDRFPVELPALARLDAWEVEERDPAGLGRFEVLASDAGTRSGALVPPDAALCPACRADMERPGDRRHQYPFTTCTDCGPRFSLVHELPYDRPTTAMACFPLCDSCRTEYENPADRRFHAEPVCCPVCGPRLWLAGADGTTQTEGMDAVRAAARALAGGTLVAVKGLGGFQLACRADSPEAVARLRERKRGSDKPFAVMAASMETARKLVHLEPADEDLLASARGPILLAPRRSAAPVAEGVAPGLEDLGVMLPTTPLHVELFRDAPFDALVMTSGNASQEPICRGNREALERLAPFVDLWLLHDRDIVRRVDDSVLRSGPGVGAAFMVRRARGYVPGPLPLPVRAPRPVLAMGGHLQVTACLAVGEQAFASQHIGDLDGEVARLFLDEVVEGLEQFLQVEAGTVAVDPHPDYPSALRGRELAKTRGARLVAVQHHLAHVAAALGEAGAFPGEGGERACGIALDGTGYGPDGSAWGGEWLVMDGALAWRRVASLEPFPLIGGEQAVRQPWRVAVALLEAAGAADLVPRLPLAGRVPGDALEAVSGLARRHVRGEGAPWPMASGAGRLLEAAGAMLGLATVNTWEGEAAARLEALAAIAARGDGQDGAGPWPDVVLTTDGIGRPRLPAAALLAAGARRLVAGQDPASVARGVHATFAHLAVALGEQVFPRSATAVGLGGGCLVNRLLRKDLSEGLEARGRRACLPRDLPAGDGGLSYGQAVIAAVADQRDVEPHEEPA